MLRICYSMNKHCLSVIYVIVSVSQYDSKFCYKNKRNLGPNCRGGEALKIKVCSEKRGIIKYIRYKIIKFGTNSNRHTSHPVILICRFLNKIDDDKNNKFYLMYRSLLVSSRLLEICKLASLIYVYMVS